MLRCVAFRRNQQGKKLFIVVTALLIFLPFASFLISNIFLGASDVTDEDMIVIDDDHISQWDWDDIRLVEHVRKFYLHQPSPVDEPYNLKNPNSRDWSHRGETKTVQKLLKGKRNGFFIECGAFDGESYSNTLPMEKYQNWTGLLVEADFINFKRLLAKKRKAWAANCCLHGGTKPVKKQFLSSLWTGSLAEYVSPIKHILIRMWRPVRTMDVWCFPLYTLMLAVNRTFHVDYFSLDVEGGEMDVLKGIPFGKLTFDMLEVEYTIFQGLYFDKDLSKQRIDDYKTFVREKMPGFTLAKKMPWNVVFINRTSEKSFNL